MTKKNLVLSSAIAALVTAGFAANSVSAYAGDEPAKSTEPAAEKHSCKSHKKGKKCDCDKKDCDGKHCGTTKDKDSCKSKGSCHSKGGDAEKAADEKPADAKPAEAAPAATEKK
jgi:hypothetical protein